MTGDPNLQRYLTDRYYFYHDQGYTKKDSHALAFRDMLDAQQQGYIINDQQPDPYLGEVYSEEGPL